MSIFKHGDREAIINSVAMFKYWRYFFPFSDQGGYYQSGWTN